jgi:hypothetical protein
MSVQLAAWKNYGKLHGVLNCICRLLRYGLPEHGVLVESLVESFCKTNSVVLVDAHGWLNLDH